MYALEFVRTGASQASILSDINALLPDSEPRNQEPHFFLALCLTRLRRSSGLSKAASTKLEGDAFYRLRRKL